MSKRQTYYYDEDQCTFVEQKEAGNSWLRYCLTVLATLVVVAGGLYVAFGPVWASPEVVALRSENEELRSSLTEAHTKIDGISAELRSLARIDQELYRTILEADPIPDDVREAGVGGADLYEDYERFSPEARVVLRETAEELDKLERQVDLQSASYRDLVALARERSEELLQLPAIMPADGRLVSGFGMRMHPIDKVRKMHYGIDITVPRGTPVVATADGIVKTTGRKGGYGIIVEISHPKTGYVTRYTHLSKIPKTTRRGRKVKRGDVIAFSGSTGRSTAPHVHYEIIDASGRQIDPIDFFAPGMTPSEYEKLKLVAEQAVSSLD